MRPRQGGRLLVLCAWVLWSWPMGSLQAQAASEAEPESPEETGETGGTEGDTESEEGIEASEEGLDEPVASEPPEQEQAPPEAQDEEEPAASLGWPPPGGEEHSDARTSSSLVAATEGDTQEAEGERAGGPEPVESASGVDEGASEREDAAQLPIRWRWHGYYRARLVWSGGVPLPSEAGPLRQEAGAAHFIYQRLRLAPSVLYGPDEERPIAALRMQFDGLDNVVFGDNARWASTPLFAEEPSVTDLDGFDLTDTFELKRVWLEFAIPVGQLRIGRMPSHWGLGLLAHGGEGFTDWGDPETQSTFDRILFATRPLTIVNAIVRGDRRPTPLITAIAYDKLVEDPVRSALDPPTRITLGPMGRRFEDRRASPPYAFLADGADDVQELIGVLLWHDPDWDLHRKSDKLSFGYYFIYRWQPSTRSDVYIHSIAWDAQLGLKGSPLSVFSAGELLGIFGSSRGIKLGGGCSDTDGDGAPDLCGPVEANILGGVARVGLTDERTWRATLEAGYSSGDPDLTRLPNRVLSSRAFHSAYRVGMLMYRVALAGRAALAMGEGFEALWPRGGVWNSRYVWPTFRYTPFPGLDLDLGVLLAWADELDGLVYVLPAGGREERTCPPIDADCFLGWEVDGALRLHWGEDDAMLWDWEFALMRAGRALSQPDRGRGLSEPWLWTVQSRVGFRF